MTASFEVFEDVDGRYHFQLKAANGTVIADSRAYSSVEHARDGMAALQRAAAEANVPDSDAEIVVLNGIHMHFAMWPPE